MFNTEVDMYIERSSCRFAVVSHNSMAPNKVQVLDQRS